MIDNTTLGFDEWLGLLRKKLPDLGNAKSLAFAASCCERSIPNYNAFARETHWGDPKVVAEALARIIHICEDNKGLLCYKHVVKTMFAATKEASECLKIAQHSVCCSQRFFASLS
jgi:uncharacterized protein YjaG (DUF416 family)